MHGYYMYVKGHLYSLFHLLFGLVFALNSFYYRTAKKKTSFLLLCPEQNYINPEHSDHLKVMLVIRDLQSQFASIKIYK